MGPSWDVAVFGSANMDLVVALDGLASPGQTVVANGSRQGPGGKGANQAVAAARFGAKTRLLACVGNDEQGAALRTVLTEAGVDTTDVQTGTAPTGLAIVMLDSHGENSIVVIAGSNNELMPPAGIGRGTGVFLAQLEVPIAGVTAAATAASADGARVILNAAPSQTLPAELCAVVDVLIVNEHEAADIAGDADDVMAALVGLVPEVIVTVGGRGSHYGNAAGKRLSVPAPVVRAVDTTAAGDTFCGVLAAALATGDAIDDAMVAATAAAALCVQRPGAMAAIPTLSEISKFRAELVGTAAERIEHGPISAGL